MISGTGLGLVLACVLIGVALGIALGRAHSTIRALRQELERASETQRSNASLLIERSALDSVKDEFISTVSHELRTPLTSIRGALGLLSAGLMGSVDAKAQNLLRIALTNTDRLIRLINDILDLERMESGRAALHVRRCSLGDLVYQAIEIMTPIADTADVALDLSVAAPAEAIYFDGDTDRILQVLTNLLSNAVKFSPASGRVQVRVEADANSVLLRVSDQGRGIPAEKLHSIFDRFEQVEAGDARQKGGTGLGLAICKTIVRQHHGAIWAESNPYFNRGPGASIVVTFPRVTRTEDAASLPHTALPRFSGDGTILICDDDAGIRAVVAEHLRQHGYTILEAERGEQALAIASAQPVEAILLDLSMPGLSGWETLQRLRDCAATASIPVVILSVLGPHDSRGQFGDHASVDGWVQKPFNEHLLLAELSRVLHTGEGSPHILLVEEDSAIASAVIAGFEDVNVRIDHASTRQNAIQRCLVARPDLLVLDLTLRDGEGFTLVDWLRQQPDLRTLPLVVYSGREVSENNISKLKLGPTQFLTKAKVQSKEVEELVLNIVQRLHRPEVPGQDRLDRRETEVVAPR